MGNGLHGGLQLGDDLVEVRTQLFHAGHEAVVEALHKITLGQCPQGIGKHADGAHARRDVSGEFHHFHHLAGFVQHRIIGGLDPYFLAVLSVADKFIRDEFPRRQSRPEIAIGRRGGIGRIAEHAVVPALDFLDVVIYRGAEIRIGGDDGAIGQKLDGRLGTGECLQLAGIVHGLDLLGGDVGGDLHDLIGFARTENRVVRGLDPDNGAVLADTAIFLGLELAAGERGPEFLIGARRGELAVAEDAMMLADDLGEIITQRRAEILICSENVTFEIEFYDRL
ncbi:hypothetical protein D3C72_1106080 [compost metagenome]